MPIVTKISVQSRRKDRYSIYMDGKYRFSLSENQLLSAGLKAGDDIAEATIEGLVEQSELGKVIDRVYNYMSYRPRSRNEIKLYLSRNGFENDTVEEIVEELDRRNLIDDEGFAKDWVESRQLLSPRSRRQLSLELRQKGIASDIIEKVLEAMQPSDDPGVIANIISTKRLRARYDERKLVQYLTSKGFTYDSVRKALELDIS